MPFVGIGVGIGRQRFGGGIFAAYAARVAADGGVTEAGACVNAVSGISLNSSLLLVPSGYKSGVVYSQIPTNGDGDLTFTRASDATRVNSDGEIEVVGSGVPRLDYSQGSCPALLLEPQRTNLTLYSEDLGNAVHNLLNVTIASNNTTSPDGTQNADKFTETTATGEHVIYDLQSNSAGVYTISCFLKQGSGTIYPVFRLNNTSGGDYALIIFDFTSGTVINTSNVGYGTPTYTVQNLGNGWYRVTMTCTTTGTFGGLRLAASNSATPSFIGSGLISYTGSTSNYFYAWGAQFEQGAYATSYIPTTSATVTRLADSFSRNNIYTNGLITSSGGTWYVELKNNVVYQRDLSFRIGLGDNTSLNSNSIYLQPFTTGRFNVVKSISGSGTVLFTTSTDDVKLAIKWNGTTADVFANGVKEVSATAFTTTLMENLLNTAIGFPTFIQAMQLYPTPLSDSDCISLTTL